MSKKVIQLFGIINLYTYYCNCSKIHEIHLLIAYFINKQEFSILQAHTHYKYS